jgi:hypothetical protein
VVPTIETTLPDTAVVMSNTLPVVVIDVTASVRFDVAARVVTLKPAPPDVNCVADVTSTVPVSDVEESSVLLTAVAAYLPPLMVMLPTNVPKFQTEPDAVIVHAVIIAGPPVKETEVMLKSVAAVTVDDANTKEFSVSVPAVIMFPLVDENVNVLIAMLPTMVPGSVRNVAPPGAVIEPPEAEMVSDAALAIFSSEVAPVTLDTEPLPIVTVEVPDSAPHNSTPADDSVDSKLMMNELLTSDKLNAYPVDVTAPRSEIETCGMALEAVMRVEPLIVVLGFV